MRSYGHAWLKWLIFRSACMRDALGASFIARKATTTSNAHRRQSRLGLFGWTSSAAIGPTAPTALDSHGSPTKASHTSPWNRCCSPSNHRPLLRIYMMTQSYCGMIVWLTIKYHLTEFIGGFATKTLHHFFSAVV